MALAAPNSDYKRRFVLNGNLSNPMIILTDPEKTKFDMASKFCSPGLVYISPQSTVTFGTQSHTSHIVCGS